MVAFTLVPSETFTVPFVISPGCPQSVSVGKNKDFIYTPMIVHIKRMHSFVAEYRLLCRVHTNGIQLCMSLVTVFWCVICAHHVKLYTAC